MRKAPPPIVTDTYDFPTIIRKPYLYVDKTALLYRLVSGVDGLMFFMSRPRRFGKSLMISTLEQIFKGERILFKGLAISKTNYDWPRHPIIRLDMTAFDHTSGLASFKRALAEELGGEEPIAAFRALITRKAKTSHGRGVVVLIDEYDSPISGLLGKRTELEAMREFLQSFYRILKQEVASIRFLMMTGVSKFTKLSVFSGLNNLTDLSMDPTYAGLLGYTQDELSAFFSPQIATFAKEQGCTATVIVSELLSWYDSYRFSPKSEVRVCNPVSVGLALRSRSFEPYWNRTGSATLIIERLRKCGKLPIDVENVKIPAKRLDVCNLDELPVEALMYQGGYLTIKSVAPDGDLVLGLPNHEVREAVYVGYLDDVLKRHSDAFTSQAHTLSTILSAKRMDGTALQNILTSIFAMVPHEWKLSNEAEAKRYFLLFMKMAGAQINVEVESSTGRADAILETVESICIFEFKYGKTAKIALAQCHKRSYAAPYAADKRRVTYVGINYDTLKRNVDTLSDTLNDTRNDALCNRIVSLVKQKPGIRRPEIMSVTGVSESTVARALRKLKSEIVFRGAMKNGGYYVV